MKNGKMKSFGNYHPSALMIYFSALLLISMFSTNPVLLFLSLLGGIAFCTVLQRIRLFWSNLAFYIPLFVMVSFSNPLFSHNGATPLFFMNGNAVTLEAILYGVDIAAMLVAVMYWCKCYNEIMSSDKFLYLFGKIIPKLSLVLSMSIRFIPQFKTQWHKISASQKSMGFYSSNSYADKVKSALRIFSALVTWSLENAVETSASMKARGYGLKGRSHFSLFRFTIRDGIMIAISVLFSAITLIGIGKGATVFYFYPKVSDIPLDIFSVAVYVVFGILSFLPFGFEVKENLKWKYYISKI